MFLSILNIEFYKIYVPCYKTHKLLNKKATSENKLTILSLRFNLLLQLPGAAHQRGLG